MRYLLPILLFSTSLFAQTPTSDDKVFSLNLPGSPSFSQCGLITRNSPSLIENISPACLQSVDNLYYDSDYSLDRRGGYSAYNLTPCTGSQKIKGLWPFNGTDGTKYIIAFSSNSMYSSIGDGTCSIINPDGASDWNLSSTQEMQCVQSQGYLWCDDGGDAPFRTNVISSQTLPGAPIGPLIGTFRNRILIGGVAGNLTQVYLSGELNGLDWSIPAVQASTSPAIISLNGVNDGLRPNCFMGEFQNQYLFGRDYDLYALSGYTLQDFTIRKVSNQIGCIEPKSVQEVNNQLIWLSKRGVESFTGTQINPISYYIRPTIAQIISASGNTRNQVINGNTPFSAGQTCVSGNNSCVSTTIFPGTVVPSSWSITDGNSTQFSAGTIFTNIDTNTLSNQIQLTSTTFSDFWSNGTTAGSLGWSVTAGSWVTSPVFPQGNNIFSQVFAGDLSNIISNSKVVYSTGSWSFNWEWITAGSGNCSGGGTICWEFRFAKKDSSNYYAARMNVGVTPNRLELIKDLAGVKNVLASGPAAAVNSILYGINIVSSPGGAMSIYFNNVFVGSATDTSVTGPFVGTEIASDGNFLGQGNGFANYFGNFKYFSYKPTGTFQSAIFDTALSTPTWGPFSSTFTVVNQNNQGQTVFYTRVSTSPNNDLWDAFTASSDTLKMTNNQKRYVQYESILSTFISTFTPVVSDVNLSAETTGYYISPAILVSTPTSWGLFQPIYSPNGGTLTFWLSTGATAALATASTATWNLQSPNAQIVVSTATTFIAARVLFGLDSSTEVPTLNSLTFNWNQGASRPPTASLQYNDRYYLFYTTNTVGTAFNDHVAVYDYNNRWTLLDDINAYSATLYLNQPYIGDSKATGTIYQLESGQSDNGGSFNYLWQTGDMDFGAPSQRKSFKRMYVFLNAPFTSNQNISLNCNYSLNGDNGNYPLQNYSLGNLASTGYSVVKFQFPTSFPTQGNWVNVSCNYLGSTGPLKVYGMQMIYSDAGWE